MRYKITLHTYKVKLLFLFLTVNMDFFATVPLVKRQSALFTTDDHDLLRLMELVVMMTMYLIFVTRYGSFYVETLAWSNIREAGEDWSYCGKYFGLLSIFFVASLGLNLYIVSFCKFNLMINIWLIASIDMKYGKFFTQKIQWLHLTSFILRWHDLYDNLLSVNNS